MIRFAILTALVGIECLAASAALAHPREIIILRHAEKKVVGALCEAGDERASALAAQYLGRGASKSLFKEGEMPAAFFAITKHTQETLAPSVATWPAPMPFFHSYVDHPPKEREARLDAQTAAAVKQVMAGYAGQIVIMAWEHKRIAEDTANKSKGKDTGPNTQLPITLYALLHLDKAKVSPDGALPTSWSGQNYNYFWIVRFAPDSEIPISVEVKRETFDAPWNKKVQDNNWGEPEDLRAKNLQDCKH